MLKKRLLWQVYPSFLLVIVISVVAVAWYASRSLGEFYQEQVKEDLSFSAYLIESQISTYLESQNFEEIDNFCKKIVGASLTRVTVILPNGKVVADSDEIPIRMSNHADRPEFREALSHDSGSSIRFSETLDKRMMYWAVPIKKDDSVLAVIRTSVPVTAIDQTLRSIYQQLFVAGSVIAVFTAGISLAISKKISHPI